MVARLARVERFETAAEAPKGAVTLAVEGGTLLPAAGRRDRHRGRAGAAAARRSTSSAARRRAAGQARERRLRRAGAGGGGGREPGAARGGRGGDRDPRRGRGAAGGRSDAADPARREPAGDGAVRRAGGAGAGGGPARSSARIGANESVFGPSPRAVAAMAEAAAGAWRYGDPENYELKAALAAHHGVGPENVAVGEGIDGLLGNLVRLLVAARHAGRDLGRRLSDLRLPRRGLRRAARHRALPRRRRGPRGAAARRAQDGRAARLPRQSRQPDGQLARCGAHRRDDRAAARRRGALPRRGLCRLRAGGRDAAARRGRAAGDPDADLLQGARDGGRAHRLCARPPGADRRLRPGAQPLRRQPHRPGRRAGGAGRPGVARAGGGRRWRRRSGAWRRSRRRTG